MIQESFSFVRTNVEFTFTRFYHLPDSPGRPVATLPQWTDLRPVDSAQKWVLNVKLNVAEDNQPDKMQKANEELMAVKAELDKLFEFKVMDRRVFDTRIAPPAVAPGRMPP
jgi:mediator of RNA polymerase II transcription subunit 18, fungi type